MPDGSVVITGASSGIGKACALHLDELGYRVFGGVRRKSDGTSLRRETSKRSVPVILDVTIPDSLNAAARKVREAIGDSGLTALDNNAGISIMGPLETLPLDDLRRQLEVNVTGVVAATQAFLPLLRRGKGRIVNIGSLGGMMAAPFLGAYSASKFALEAITDALRMELAPWEIGVTIIEPANTATPIWDKPDTVGKALAKVPKAQRDLYREPLERMREAMARMSEEGAAPEVVAKVVAEAIAARSPKARYFAGTDDRLLTSVMKMLPDRIQDSLVLRALGQGK